MASYDPILGWDGETTYNVYPVPNNGTFTASISNPVEQLYTISIYNSIGALVYEKKDVLVNGITEEVIEFDHVVTGIYHVVFWNEDQRVVKKVPVNR